MADNTATDNEGLWFPDEVWITIASFLDNSDLARFRQLCSTIQFFGSEAFILQPHYNRLYALDSTLPPTLPQKDTLVAFKQAAEKIHTQQQSEIDYLTLSHPDIMKNEQVFEEKTTMSLKSLEAKSVALDNINSDIIREKIDLTSSSLDLNKTGISRFPSALFQEPLYVNFWKNVTHLNCNNNRLSTLNMQGVLPALQSLSCIHNPCLTILNVQGLTTLKKLWCFQSGITTLNLQGLTALQELFLDVNLLTDLNITGVHPDIKNIYAELELILLFNKLSQTKSFEDRCAIIRRLGDNYTHDNCLKYYPDDAETLFEINLATPNNALSQPAAFLTSFDIAKAGLKRKRDEEIDTEELSEEPDNQPALKKRKKR